MDGNCEYRKKFIRKIISKKFRRISNLKFIPDNIKINLNLYKDGVSNLPLNKLSKNELSENK